MAQETPIYEQLAGITNAKPSLVTAIVFSGSVAQGLLLLSDSKNLRWIHYVSITNLTTVFYAPKYLPFSNSVRRSHVHLAHPHQKSHSFLANSCLPYVGVRTTARHPSSRKSARLRGPGPCGLLGCVLCAGDLRRLGNRGLENAWAPGCLRFPLSVSCRLNCLVCRSRHASQG